MAVDDEDDEDEDPQAATVVASSAAAVTAQARATQARGTEALAATWGSGEAWWCWMRLNSLLLTGRPGGCWPAAYDPKVRLT